MIIVKTRHFVFEVSATANRAFESLISANVECKIGKIEYSFEGDLTDAEKAEKAITPAKRKVRNVFFIFLKVN